MGWNHPGYEKKTAKPNLKGHPSMKLLIYVVGLLTGYMLAVEAQAMFDRLDQITDRLSHAR
jgi:hypothetical protein